MDDSVIAEHIVITTRHRRRDLLEFQIAAWLWSHIAAALPQAFSLALMPDHLHLMAPPGCVPRLRAVLTGATQRFGIRFDIAVFDQATTPQILGRMIRYGFYNPVRAGLVDDPWRWPWSSLRDLAACVFPVWTELGHVAQALRLSPSRALRGLTSLGEQRPAAPAVALPAVVSPQEAAVAVASVLRLPSREVCGQRLGRRLVVQASELPSSRVAPRDLAGFLGIQVRSLPRLRSPEHPALEAVRLALSDRRLCPPS